MVARSYLSLIRALNQAHRANFLFLDDFRGLTPLKEWRRGWYRKESRLKSVGRVAIPSVENKDLGRGKRGRNRGSEPSGAFLRFLSTISGVDLLTPAGRMMAKVLASVNQFETEVRRERIAAGLAVAKENGVKLGRKPGIHTRD